MFVSKYHMNKYGQCTINIGDSTITPAHHVRDLGVQVDQHLSMAPRVTAFCASCNYHLYRLSSIRRYLTVNATRTVVQALITSRLDYCNSLMINIPSTQMDRLQKIQNKAARMISRVPSSRHITPVLQQLHWLPVRCRRTYKILVTVSKCLHALAPTYLIELAGARKLDIKWLRHTDTRTPFLHQPVARKHVGEQAFGTAAPFLWNNLPTQLWSATTHPAFKTALKTYFFKQYFEGHWSGSIRLCWTVLCTNVFYVRRDDPLGGKLRFQETIYYYYYYCTVYTLVLFFF